MTASPAPLLTGIEDRLASLQDLYRDLHAHPELSHQEVRTAGIVAARLREQGWRVTEGVGGTGVVGTLANGPGPVVLLRADMDALPVREATGLPYASTRTAVDADGETVPVMHACGHDLHVTCLLGATALLAANRSAWRGTVVAVFQPAEEVGGAPAMLDDGFLDRFPRADVCLAQHVAPAPAGLVALRPGPMTAAADGLAVRLHGRGGHGSSPASTVDPVVMAAAVVLRLQTVVSREVAPERTAVLSVGSINAGTRENVIPDTADLKLTLRSTTSDVREQLLAAVERIVQAEAAASAAPKPPETTLLSSFPATVNDPAASATVDAAFRTALGADAVLTLPQPLTGAEDFGVFGSALGVPSVYWVFGGLDPAGFAGLAPADLATGLPPHIPHNHSPLFAPVPERAVRDGVRCLLLAAGAWLVR
ncbi:amidohydrolase [Streptomyces sp. Da 82-17]|uniref:amidohydrolase n=1 Tax=Streptomyces sp. Da 82-17 TaxID=3377116 RepID=UPI0038D4D478